MHPADFSELARRDRERAARHLRCYGGPGLWRLAAECAQHLFERFEVRVPPDHVLAIWQRVALITEQQEHSACALEERAVGAQGVSSLLKPTALRSTLLEETSR